MRRRCGWHRFVHMSDRGAWRVLLATPPSDVEALRFALPRVITPGHYGLVTESLPDGSDGDSMLWVDIVAGNQESALSHAASSYAEVRRLAQLPAVAGEVLGLWPPSFVEQPWHRLLKEAQLPVRPEPREGRPRGARGGARRPRPGWRERGGLSHVPARRGQRRSHDHPPARRRRGGPR